MFITFVIYFADEKQADDDESPDMFMSQSQILCEYIIFFRLVHTSSIQFNSIQFNSIESIQFITQLCNVSSVR